MCKNRYIPPIFSFFHFFQYGWKKHISSGAVFSTEISGFFRGCGRNCQPWTWCWSSDKPLPELMLVCVTQPQWVNYDELLQGLFCVCAQPIRNGVTLQCYLLLAGCIHVMIPASDIWRSSLLDSLAPQRCEWNFRFNSQTQSSDGCLKCFLWNWLRWMSLNLSDDKSILFQLMTCCCPATSHYLS